MTGEIAIVLAILGVGIILFVTERIRVDCVSDPDGTFGQCAGYGPGGYRFAGYTKVGIPLTLVVLVVALGVVPIYVPFGSNGSVPDLERGTCSRRS